MRFLSRFRLSFLGENSSSSRNGDRAFHENAPPAKSNGDQTSINASRDNQAGPRNEPAFAIEPVTLPSLKAAAVSIEGSKQDAIGLGFGSCGQLDQLADISATASCKDGATLSTPMPALISTPGFASGPHRKHPSSRPDSGEVRKFD